MEVARIFDSLFGWLWPIPAGQFLAIWNSQNLGFSVFLRKFGNFFFQNAILGKIGHRTIKNGVSEIL
jgi:hypothetical protein